MIEFDVKIEAGDLYNYMMAHAYGSASGLIGSCFGALMIVIFGLDPRQWIFLICGVILLLYLPVSLYLKSKQLALTNPSFQKALHYVLDEEGISVSQGETTERQACTKPRPREGVWWSTPQRSVRPYFPTGIWGNSVRK
jgi:MFS family permease